MTVLAPPSDDAHGTVPGDAPTLSLAVVGESTAAGCGVRSHRDGFAHLLAEELAGRDGREVSWLAVGQYGATAYAVRALLVPRLPVRVDLAVVLVGVNDVLALRSATQWRADLSALLGAVSGHADTVVLGGIPPFEVFPALPATLGGLLARRGRALEAISAEVCDDLGVTLVPPRELGAGPDVFAEDGFHPGLGGYRAWAHATAASLTGPLTDDAAGQPQ